jgi:alpha-beta hydrolase superfamily lysophospholipase
MSVFSTRYIVDGLSHPLFVRQWLPEGEVKGLVQICHGMAEHSARYARLGEFLAGHGYAVFCHDHRGHGETCGDRETKGFFSEDGGWDLLVSDAEALGKLMREEIKEGRFILFGHSMGSLIVSDMAALGRGTQYDAFVLCGSPAPNPGAAAGKTMAAGIMHMGLGKKPSSVINSIAFGGYNKHFADEKDPFSWLTRDKSVREAYERDPNCGFLFTAAGFYALFDGICRVRSDEWALRTECKPFLVISGGEDPVGNYGQAVDWIRDQLQQQGRDVTAIGYPGMRHEILNELDNDKVYDDILQWMDEVSVNG